jgi:hypothetical protein
MTLSPVFRSKRAVELLREEGILARMRPALEAQARAVQVVHADLEPLLDEAFRVAPPPVPGADSGDGVTSGLGTDLGAGGDPGELSFLQEYFFLVLFRSLFESLGIPASRLERYAEVNFCIKGTITAADNLFDDQAKRLLPLNTGAGTRFLSILQLMCFERLIRRALDRGVHAGEFSGDARDAVLKGLLDMMARIGALEGSEEGGVREIPTPAEMVERVHRVRGGALFALAFVAPAVLEEGAVLERIQQAEPAIARLGTAFQIVDDLTDFEFDLSRRSHNLLISQIHHFGTPEEKAALEPLLNGGEASVEELVAGPFRESARAVLERAYDEAHAAFAALEALGFWFPASLSEEVVHAIVGLDGVRRMERLTGV